MPTNYHEEITKLLDSAGLIDKTLSFKCGTKEGYFLGHGVDHWKNALWDDERKKIVKNNYSHEPEQIIGHDWDLREVMAWFRIQVSLRPYMLDEDGCRIANDGRGWDVLPLNIIDLSKPLSQQDLKPLWELMKSISDNK